MRDFVKIERTEECCGCGACVCVCPRGAVSMCEDPAGFTFPRVDESLCVRCGKCVDVCVFTDRFVGANGDPAVYAAVTNDSAILSESSSGGVFTELANAVIDRGGVVFGAAWTDDLSVAHIRVDSKDELKKLRGSKYVQSSTGDTFRQVKELLKDGVPVCYSGTPCQIAGLKSYVGDADDGLLTVDIICHGVPSTKMLHDDLEAVSGAKISDIDRVSFRDKSFGWDKKTGRIVSGKGTKKYSTVTSPYYFFFLKGEVFRDSCYNCRFPSEGRQGDITLGDYWGIDRELVSQLGADPDKGISCVLANTENGRKWLADIGERLTLVASDRKSVERKNVQLTRSSAPLPEHETLLEGYKINGYSAIRNGFKNRSKDRLIGALKNIMPSKLKRAIANTVSSIKGK